MTKQITFEAAEKIVDSFNYFLINLYAENRNSRVIIKDSFGYKYDVLLNNFVKNKGGVNFVHKGNPFSLENISLWLRINNREFTLSKNNVYVNSSNKLIFKCNACNKLFDMAWLNVYSGQNCPYCSGKRFSFEKSLGYNNPELSFEWDYNRNQEHPDEVFSKSHKKVWWLCSKCGGSWIAMISDRCNGHGCPYCSGNRVSDSNRLSILYPKISLEWNYDKNGSVTPNDVSFGSSVIFWWQCNKCGFEWETSIAERTSGRNCPKCNFSKGEDKICFWLNKNNLLFETQKTFPNCKNILELPFDFYLPEYNLCIEYDGILHYEDKFNNPKEFKLTQKRDKIKTKYCKDNDINLLRIPYWDFNNIEKILEQTLF